TMEVGDFTSTVACFMRLTWAAAAGRLDLVGSQQPIRETQSSLLPQGVRTRVSSTGICVRQQSVSIKDAIIAREALSLLASAASVPETLHAVLFLSTASFYNLPSVSDFIIDILLGSPSAEYITLRISSETNHMCLIRCSTASSRLAAYEVLVMLADSSLSNLRLITKELLSMHHQSDPSLCKEFDAFLSIEDDTDQPEESVFYQVQSLFGHLMESKLQYYVPENFWKVTDFSSKLSGNARGRWYKFNDNVVEEFDMNDETLEYECFGGEANNDRLTLLTRLVRKGEKKGLFVEKMPASIFQVTCLRASCLTQGLLC
ncbi:hypothetical protein XENOCAPTIV_000089, partial [Xenoophorus captivus]